MIVLPAVLQSFRSRVDRSITIQFETGEVSPEEVSGVAQNLQTAGFLAFNKDVFKTEQLSLIEEMKADYEDRSKTPSKRLRDVLFIAYKQKNEGYEQFEDYYRSKLEKFINHVKSKLE
jgi:hypothetical protein